MKKILLIIGSIRKDSYNYQLGKIIKEMIGDKAEVEFIEYQDLPYMNQDEEFPVLDVVKRIRSKVIESDGLWFVTPEYNRSYPGILKNLIDWLSRPLNLDHYEDGTAISDKKVTYSSVAGRSKGIGVRDKLHELLKFVDADILNAPSVGIGLTKEGFERKDLIISLEDEVLLKLQVKAFLEFIDA